MRTSRAETARAIFAGLALSALLLSSCGARTPSITLPPNSAAPEAVLDAYLRTLVAGDCDTGRKLAVDGFRQGAGNLCGQTTVSTYRIDGPPAVLSDERVFSATLTTSGTSDRGGGIQAGPLTWFFDLKRQADGSWRIAGGGSGP